MPTKLDGWKEYELGQLLNYEQPSPYIVKSTNYSDTYSTPVLTAGKSFIIGYTDETVGIYNSLPVIIFDDFTTSSQHVNFPFKVKSSAMKILSPNVNLVLPKFIYYRMQIIQFDHSTHKRYWIQQYSKIKVQIPSIPEQERIVSKIEELFSRLDASVAELQAAKEKLSAYRQAVLKEAFANSTRTELVEMSEIAEDIRIGPFGTMLHKSDYISDGVPVINPQHIKNLSIIPSRKITVSQEMAVELSSYRLRENDIIMGRRGEMGRAAAITKSEAGWICGTGSLLFRLKPEYDASFYAQILSSPDIVHYLEDHATGTTMKNLNEHIVKHIPVPKVTKQMQKVIVSRLEEETSICDSIGQAIDTSLRQAESLRQSILKQAFEGNL
ncbi:restriction endonuclease subunit S [uncultured Subdoligranulum sp.]|uniref:restriction endonuclease subunit S n=1 Tax=uncultured Subdoligranulum sp. TaxID=512298 RepID=UPI00260F4DAD|nr:restriction endonuclease subunit S [uncultured Subdoligranulum sp.]